MSCSLLRFPKQCKFRGWACVGHWLVTRYRTWWSGWVGCGELAVCEIPPFDGKVGGWWMVLVCVMCVFSICVWMVVGPLVWHGVGGGKVDVRVAGLVAVKLWFVKFPL